MPQTAALLLGQLLPEGLFVWATLNPFGADVVQMIFFVNPAFFVNFQNFVNPGIFENPPNA